MLEFIKDGLLGGGKIIGFMIMYILVVLLAASVAGGVVSIFNGNLDTTFRVVGGLWALFWIFLGGAWFERNF